MFKNKTVKLFLILGVILFSLTGVVGCSDEKIYEKKVYNVISFPTSVIDNSTISAIPRFTINLNHDNSNFVCKTYKGSFSEVEEKKNISSLNIIHYYPTYEFNNEKDYIDILIYNDSKVIGYAVIEIIYIEAEKWKIDLVESNFFINKHGEIVNVNEDYAKNRIEAHHK